MPLLRKNLILKRVLVKQKSRNLHLWSTMPLCPCWNCRKTALQKYCRSIFYGRNVYAAWMYQNRNHKDYAHCSTDVILSIPAHPNVSTCNRVTMFGISKLISHQIWWTEQLAIANTIETSRYISLKLRTLQRTSFIGLTIILAMSLQ